MAVVVIMIIIITTSGHRYDRDTNSTDAHPYCSMEFQWEVSVIYDLGDSGRTLCNVGFAVGTDVPVPRIEVALGEGDGPLSFCDSNLSRWSCEQTHVVNE